MQTCKNCNVQFDHPEHFKAYLARFKDVMGLPAEIPLPDLCSSCRAQRRFSFRNEMNLYRRQCSLCKKDIVAMYDADALFPVYCRDCFWSDSWDAMSFGRPFDFFRPFFEQYHELLHTVPRIALMATPDCVGSDYANYIGSAKNSYLIFGSIIVEDCYYGSPYYSKNCVDILVSRHCEYSYELIDCQNLYTSAYCQDCENSHDIAFCHDVKNSSDCIGCVGLRSAQFCIYNEQLTEQEYKKRKAEMPLWDPSVRHEIQQKVDELTLKIPHRYMRGSKNEQVSGDYIFASKNTFESFFVEKCEDSAFLGQTIDMKDCYDCNFTENDELLYNYLGSWKVQRSLCSLACHNSSDLFYSDFCTSCSNLFGCISLKNKANAILNQEYAPDEWRTLRDKIIPHMKETGEWGQYVLPKYSPLAFNESVAIQYYPLSKEEVITRGWKWKENVGGTTGRETIAHDTIPASIEEVPDDIIKEILACQTCGKNYKLIKQELAFYKKFGYGTPRLCPSCRHCARLAKRNPRQLWIRQCDCIVMTHDHSARCSTEFQATYAPDRSEHVFCEACYQKEMV
ncbi:MAG: hypothetical protein AAB855_01725 [Patescibacteria group bacterium]